MRNPLGRLSLRVRLTAFAALGAAVTLTVGALLLYSGLSSAIDDAVTAELRVRATDVAAELRAGSAPLSHGAGLVTQVIDLDGSVRRPAGASPILDSTEVVRAHTAEIVEDRAIEQVGEDARVLAVGAEAGPSDEVVVAVAGSTAPLVAARERLALVLGVAGPLMVVLLAGGAWMLTGAALRPVEQMTRRAETISLQDHSARLPQPPGHDEIAHLGRTLNAMLGRIAETIARERAFVDDASHELRSPLAVLRGELELTLLELDDDADHDDVRAALGSALEETDRLAGLTEHMLVLARADAGQLGDKSVPLSLRNAAETTIGRLELQHVRVEVTGHDVCVAADPLLIDQLLTNLLENAARWARSRVKVDIGIGDTVTSDTVTSDTVTSKTDTSKTVTSETITGGRWAHLVVSDDGPGFDKAIADRAFDRFTRGDPSRSRAKGGAGLGLAIVAGVAGALGGRAEVANGPPLGGAVVRVHLPRATTSAHT